MNNNYYQPARDFIPVVGQDAETVLAYNQMMDRISSEPTDGMIDPFIIPKTEEELQLPPAAFSLTVYFLGVQVAVRVRSLSTDHLEPEV